MCLREKMTLYLLLALHKLLESISIIAVLPKYCIDAVNVTLREKIGRNYLPRAAKDTEALYVAVQ